MPNDLIEYIKNCQAQKISRAEIESKLLQTSWSKDQIDQAFIVALSSETKQFLPGTYNPQALPVTDKVTIGMDTEKFSQKPILIFLLILLDLIVISLSLFSIVALIKSQANNTSWFNSWVLFWSWVPRSLVAYSTDHYIGLILIGIFAFLGQLAILSLFLIDLGLLLGDKWARKARILWAYLSGPVFPIGTIYFFIAYIILRKHEVIEYFESRKSEQNLFKRLSIYILFFIIVIAIVSSSTVSALKQKKEQESIKQQETEKFQTLTSCEIEVPTFQQAVLKNENNVNCSRTLIYEMNDKKYKEELRSFYYNWLDAYKVGSKKVWGLKTVSSKYDIISCSYNNNIEFTLAGKDSGDLYTYEISLIPESAVCKKLRGGS